MALPIFGYFMQSLYNDRSIGLSTADFKEPAGYDPNEFDCENTEDSTNSSSFGI
jgi:hypothetical protein